MDLSKEYDSHTEVMSLLENGRARGQFVQKLLTSHANVKRIYSLVFDTCFDSFTMKYGQVIGRGKTNFHEFSISGEYDNNHNIWFKFDVLSGSVREKNMWSCGTYGSISKNEKNEIVLSKKNSKQDIQDMEWYDAWVNESFHFECQPV